MNQSNPSKPIKILDYLYLGNFDAADYSNLKDYNISAVVCLTSDSHEYPEDINLYHIDNISENLDPNSFNIFQLQDAIKFIDNEIKNKNNILVHCMLGSSRSPTVIIAYVMKSLKMTVTEACLFVKQKAPHINPTFMDLLDEWQTYL